MSPAARGRELKRQDQGGDHAADGVARRARALNMNRQELGNGKCADRRRIKPDMAGRSLVIPQFLSVRIAGWGLPRCSDCLYRPRTRAILDRAALPRYSRLARRVAVAAVWRLGCLDVAHSAEGGGGWATLKLSHVHSAWKCFQSGETSPNARVG